MTNRHRATLLTLAAIVLAAAVLIAVVAGGDDETTSAGTQTATTVRTTATTGRTTTTTVPKTTTIVVRDGKPVGGVQRLEFDKGGTIRFAVRSDVVDEIHFHGYDIAKDVIAGGTVRFAVPATIDGRFVVELEQRGTEIAEVDVQP